VKFIADPDTLHSVLDEIDAEMIKSRIPEGSEYGIKPPEPRRVNPMAFHVEPTGFRIHVIKDSPPKGLGLIEFPQETQDQMGSSMGCGVVLSVGPNVGFGGTPYPGGWQFEGDPRDLELAVDEAHPLLYQHVIFGSYTGNPVRFDILKDDTYTAEVISLLTKDIWAVRTRR
jgi:hypothetical protein